MDRAELRYKMRQYTQRDLHNDAKREPKKVVTHQTSNTHAPKQKPRSNNNCQLTGHESITRDHQSYVKEHQLHQADHVQERRLHQADQQKIRRQQLEIKRLREARTQSQHPKRTIVSKSSDLYGSSQSNKSAQVHSHINDVSHSSSTSNVQHRKYNTYDERMKHISSKLVYSRSTPLSIDEMGPLQGYFNHYTRYKHDKDKSNEHSIKAKNDRFVYYYKNLSRKGHRNANSFQVRFPRWFRPYARHLLTSLSGETSATIDDQPIKQVLMQLICLLDPVIDRRDMIADAMCNAQPHSTRKVKQGYRNIQKKLDDNQARLRHNNTLKYMARDTHVALDNQVNHLNRLRSAKLYARERMLTRNKLLVIFIAQTFHESIPKLMKDKTFWEVWGSSITDHAAHLLYKRTNAIGKSSHKRIGTNITNRARKGR